MNHLISIVVPVYNVEEYLHRCVDSILLQTYRNLEIILVNDGSSDNSFAICDEFAAKDCRIKVIHKPNGGLSSARNAGIDIAEGDFLGFVDGDDFIEKDMYEKLLQACIENNVALSMCGRYNFKEDGSTVPVFVAPGQEVWSGKQAISNLLIWNKIDSSACDKLFRKELFIDIRFPHEKVCEDVFVIPQILSNTAFLVHIGEAKYIYYQRAGSISHSVFSLSRMNMLDAHKEVSEFVKLKYPDLKKKADSFFFNAFLFLYIDFFSTSAFNNFFYLKRTIDDLAHFNFYSILTNQYVSLRSKMLFVLIYFKMYAPFKKIKVLLSNTLALQRVAEKLK